MTEPGSGAEPGGRWLGVLVAVLGIVAILAILAPVILTSAMPSVAELLTIPVIVLVGGAVLRRDPSARTRAIGSIAIALGLLAFVALAILLWALVNGAGRPY